MAGDASTSGPQGDVAHVRRPLSLHQRIRRDIEGNILSGRWPPGHRIPSEQALTDTYGCSRMTVNKVLTELARAGLVLRRRKTGSVVMPQDGQSAILEIYDIGEEVRALNLAYCHRVLSRTVRRPSKSEQALSTLPARGKVLAVSVLHFAGEEPFCLEERIINLAIAPEAEAEAFEALAPGQWLLKHVPWSAAEHRISADAATASAAAALGLFRAAPVLVVERQTWRLEETVTRVRLTYPGSQHALTARFTPVQGRQFPIEPS
ncbi:histidine utilization repressor [Rhizobium straminoryzae]|uniref:Histidine utilization repressor n=1 Tax=Rhizobium straminoryzae TaxID=1387186 RepID=A0A549SXM1_9HYPH|nr:histidine utilization repressor [Rhizobium straminoryzae]TRL34360.1 histidine utilization repressor [Rhizobium straminoryzae]